MRTSFEEGDRKSQILSRLTTPKKAELEAISAPISENKQDEKDSNKKELEDLIPNM